MENSFQIGDWLVDSIQNRLVRGDARVKLDPKVMQVLLCLAERPNEVVLKEKVLEKVWEGTFVADEVLTNAIFELRKAFGDDAKEPRFIQTIPRKGYRLLAPVQSGDAPVGVALPSRRAAVLPWVLLAAALVAVAALSVLPLGRGAPRAVSRFDINLPPEEALTHLNDPAVAFSPDGTRLVYLGGEPRKLYIRAIDEVQSKAIPGTEGAGTAFFSPDGEWVGFYTLSVPNKLKKVRLATGSVVTLCDAPNGWGASWGDDETILFTTGSSGLHRIPASGGAPSAVTSLDASPGAISHRWPEFLPGAKAALFTIWSGTSVTSRIALLQLETGEHRVLVEGASFARYSPTGHIVYAREGRLEAAPFDLDSLEVGPAVPLSLEVRSLPQVGTAHFSLSRESSLAYVAPIPERTLLWVDRNGWTRPLTETRREYEHPRLSPDGKRLAVTILDAIWVYALERDGFTRLSGSGVLPVWTPDGERITFKSVLGKPAIVWQAADGSGAAEKLAPMSVIEPGSWSPDGKWFVYTAPSEKTRADIWVLSLEGERSARPFPMRIHIVLNWAEELEAKVPFAR